ncbi:MAG: hypothetical protein ABSG68_14270 [Thermoguttaceae bacterium]
MRSAVLFLLLTGTIAAAAQQARGQEPFPGYVGMTNDGAAWAGPVWGPYATYGGAQSNSGWPGTVGEFNCCCRGSYKYPVPPQYTYHWPGIYSQQTMTAAIDHGPFPPLLPAPQASRRRLPRIEQADRRIAP